MFEAFVLISDVIILALLIPNVIITSKEVKKLKRELELEQSKDK